MEKLRIPEHEAFNDPEGFFLHYRFFAKGLRNFARRLLRSEIQVHLLGHYVLLSWDSLSLQEQALVKAILEKFFQQFATGPRCKILEDYVFLNIFYPISDSLIVNIFRLTNVFDTSTEVWRTGKFQRFLAFIDSSDKDLAETLRALASRFDRQILRNLVQESSAVKEYLLRVYSDYQGIKTRIERISSSNLLSLLEKVENSNYDVIDLIKDLRNVAVHGFSSKNLLMEKYLKERFFELLKFSELSSALNDLYDMLLALELRMLLAAEYLQPAPNTSSER